MIERYSGATPPGRSRHTKVVRVQTAENQQFCIVSRSIFGQYVHWYGNRTHQCTREKSKCNGCERAWPSKWLGYLHVIPLGCPDAFLELTAAACDDLVEQAPEDKPLCGLQVRIRKTKGGKKGRYIIEILERRVDPATLPQERDPLDTLLFLWKCKNQHLNGAEVNGSEME